ncbi:conserved unknown protein [Ectocarpus siliculosus]|uniref:Myb-like domain-containing protein n=1 Tax=Ectocarpus siliculosus TaxID=2880 RepID=D7G4K1_ECTSI|nr:conserved unknown protein [Ectocarpus siliculosus]|eukprot:CBJ48904.1 conserved unknown protein [Ectocarpus siliculosus]
MIFDNLLRSGASNYLLRPQQDHGEETFEESGGGGGGSSSSSDGGRTGLACGSTPATGRWTKKEHADFLVGLEACGKDWMEISCHFVFSRTATQIRTHAQKYFTKVNRGQSFPEQPYESVPGKRNTCDDRSGSPGDERHCLNRPTRSSSRSSVCNSHSSSGESVDLSSRTRSGVAKRKHAALAQEEQRRKEHDEDQQHQERPHQELQHHEDQHHEDRQHEEPELQEQQDQEQGQEQQDDPRKQSRPPGVEWPAPLHDGGGMMARFKEPRDARHEDFGDECEQAFFTVPDVAECNFGSSPLSSFLEDTPGAEYFGVPPTDRHGAAPAIAAAAAAGDTAGGPGSRHGGSGGDGEELDSTLAESRLGGGGGWHDWYPTEGWVDKQQAATQSEWPG